MLFITANQNAGFQMCIRDRVKSMTGFGRCEVSEGERKMTVEMKSVNHRYLDVAIKLSLIHI